MRSAGNFHPEWGYLAPAPSFMRTARIVLVAMAIGATAGAAVIISLVPRPAADAGNTSIAAHALVTSVPVVDEPPVAAAPTDEPALAQSPTPSPSQSAVAAVASPAPAVNLSASNAANATKANSISPPASQASGGVAALSGPAPATVANAESPSSAISEEAAADPDATVKSTKKHRSAGNDRRGQPGAKRWHNNRPFQPLFSLFSGSRRSF
jgi:hypothetical protein